jgi:hypothetical protein
MFNMTSDSHIFKEDFHDGHVPLYESKIFNNYDHRYTTYENATQANINSGILPRIEDESKKDPSSSLKPFYWLDKKDLISKTNSEEWKWNKNWFLAFRIITNSTSERTSVFSIIPRCGVGNSAAVMLTKIEHTDIISCLLANFNSLAFDFIARQKIGGNNLNLFVVKQLPVLPPESYTPQDIEFISSRVLELVYTAWDMQPFAQDMGYQDAPFVWNPERRAILRAELDAKYAKLYGLTRDELRYILDPKGVYGEEFPSETFRVLRDKEMKEYGEYRTQRLVLAAWDDLESGGKC